MSSTHCPSSPSHHTSVEQKIRSRNAARQYKIGSPKLRDLLREKCRARVRESRRASFDGARNIVKIADNSLVSKILRQELADLESDLHLQEYIYEDLIGEMNMWFVEQLEEEEQYLIEVGDAVIVFCPVCQKSGLEQSSDKQINCQCGVSFDFTGTLESLHAAILNVINEHEEYCQQVVHFFVEENTNDKRKILNAMCDNCDFFHTLT